MSTALNYRSLEDFDSTRTALRELLVLAAPTVAQMASYTVMQFIDTWLLSHYGSNKLTGLEPTAASNAGLFAFSLISLGFGAMFVVNTLVSQSYGRGDKAACGRYLWQGIWFAVIYAVLLLPLIPLGSKVFVSFGHERTLADAEGAYLRIMVAGAGLKLVQIALGQFLLAINLPVTVMIATICGVSANALAAWVLIYGKFGFPPLGIRGSAMGQNIGVFVEMSVLLLFVVRKGVRDVYGLPQWRFRAKEFRTLLMIGLPAGAQLVADVLAWALFCVWVMAPFGTDTMAANTFTFRFFSVSFMPAYGISTAVTALVGRYIGRGRPDLAVQRARLGFILCAIYMVTCGVGFFVGRRVLLGLFTDSQQIIQIGATLLVFAAIYQFFDAMYIVYNGALRGAGDTLVPAIVTGLLCWGITVFGGRLLAKLYPQWGAAGPWAAATLYGAVLGAFIYARFARGRWKDIRLTDTSNVSAPSATVQGS